MGISKIKLYYILVGIGIGVIISGIIMTMNPSIEVREYTDDEIISRARELGMISIKENIEQNNEANEDTSDTEKPKDETRNENETSADNIKQEENIVLFEVEKGDSTEKISKKLLDEGLIEDADEFSSLIIKLDVEKSIRYGIYELTKDTDYETIINILTHKIKQ